MTSETGAPPVPENYFLRPGFIYMAEKATTIATVLGSCVSVCLYDRKRNLCGMNHFQYPLTRERKQATARYGNVAIPAMVKMMLENGARKRNMEAQIFGGAHNPAISQQNVGGENIRIARRILSRQGIRIASEDVGGEKGRKVIFKTATNELAVIKVDKLRLSDWYPYASDR